MTANEKLRALLREAGAYMLADPKANPGYAENVLELHGRITAALAEPVAENLERTILAPGEGTWSVFAMKVVQERDAARAEIGRLQLEVDRLNAVWADSLMVLRETVKVLASVIEQATGRNP